MYNNYNNEFGSCRAESKQCSITTLSGDEFALVTFISGLPCFKTALLEWRKCLEYVLIVEPPCSPVCVVHLRLSLIRAEKFFVPNDWGRQH